MAASFNSNNTMSVCRYFNPFTGMGCKNGSNCRFLHLTESDAQLIVSKYGRNIHSNSRSTGTKERLYIESNVYCVGTCPQYRFCTHGSEKIERTIILDTDLKIDLGEIEFSNFNAKQSYLETKCMEVRDIINKLIDEKLLHSGYYHLISDSDLYNKYREYCGKKPECSKTSNSHQRYHAKATECVLDGNKFVVTISACPEIEIKGFFRSEIERIVLPVKSELL